jgi:hypothetical protein
MGFSEFLIKVLTLPSRVGGSVALAALALYLLRASGIEPFSSFDATLYRYIVVAGLLGAVVSIVEVLLITLRGTGNLIMQTLSKWQVYQARRKQAQKSMGALPPEYADVLWYLDPDLRGERLDECDAIELFLADALAKGKLYT